MVLLQRQWLGTRAQELQVLDQALLAKSELLPPMYHIIGLRLQNVIPSLLVIRASVRAIVLEGRPALRFLVGDEHDGVEIIDRMLSKNGEDGAKERGAMLAMTEEKKH